MSVHRKKLTKLLIGCIIGNSVPLTLAVISFAWFYSNTRARDQNVDGSVGLREYFYRGDGYIGDGSELYPHEIVTPLHFYNLTRLQNLGVFPEKTYFRVGHVFEGYEAEGPKCLDGDVKVDVLDLTSFCATNPLLPIGNEGTPFYGEFDGNFIPIVGLRVAGNPEDIGMFGYTAYTSTVKNVICKNLEVSSYGYSTSGEENFLYSQEIDDIFSQNAENFELATLNLVSTYEEANHTHNLKSVEPFSVDDLLSKSEVVNDATSQFNGKRILKAKLIPSFPTINNHNIEYSVSTSAGVIVPEKNTNNLIVDLDNLPVEFNDSTPVRMNFDISLVASIKLNGYKYSRVIQSYNVEVRHAPIVDNGPLVLSLIITCDHVIGAGNNPINNGHGNNIGYLVGHADGNVVRSYVYNGTLLFNSNDENLHNIETQSESGLIGKTGLNVISDINPQFGATSNGETGVLNFSHIYSLIREPFQAGDQTIAGYNYICDSNGNFTSTQKTFISYAVDHVDGEGKYGPRGAAQETFDLYKEYLRCDTASPYKHYITSAGGQGDIIENNVGSGSDYTFPNGNNFDTKMNSVDFAPNKVICDGTSSNENRGLGVFKIVTAYSSIENNHSLDALSWRNTIGDCSIIYDSTPKTAIYFSTAEADWNKGNTFSPLIMNTLPSFSNVGSFRYPFSRDFNYLFKLDLTEAANFKKGNELYNYMYDTDSEFLKNYLSSILIDKLGKPISWRNKGFGFKVQFSQDSTRPVTGLNSYMLIGQPTTPKQYTVNGETKYYPEKSVAFTIENPNGANVSIAGCGGDISIYRYDPNSPSTPEELYTMASTGNSNTGSYNMGRFFPYSSTGETNTAGEVLPQGGNMTHGSFLFGHIFKLPRGTYVIGSSRKTGHTSARLYYVCVQGQTNGDLGEINMTTLGNTVMDVDFLLKDPVTNPFNLNDNSFFANFSFSGNFTDLAGKMVVDTTTVNNNVYIRARFNDFITYLLFYDRKSNPRFVINNESPILGTDLYSGPYQTFTVWGP